MGGGPTGWGGGGSAAKFCVGKGWVQGEGGPIRVCLLQTLLGRKPRRIDKVIKSIEWIATFSIAIVNACECRLGGPTRDAARASQTKESHMSSTVIVCARRLGSQARACKKKFQAFASQQGSQKDPRGSQGSQGGVLKKGPNNSQKRWFWSAPGGTPQASVCSCPKPSAGVPRGWRHKLQ